MGAAQLRPGEDHRTIPLAAHVAVGSVALAAHAAFARGDAEQVADNLYIVQVDGQWVRVATEWGFSRRAPVPVVLSAWPSRAAATEDINVKTYPPMKASRQKKRGPKARP